MDEPKPEQKGPGAIRRFFSKVAAAPKKLLSISLAAKAAWLTALVLVALVTTAWVLFLVDPDSVPWRHSMTFGRIAAVLALTVIIPIVVYRGLKLWLEGESSRFPEIDFAWKAGVTALERSGLHLDATPIFLVVGAADERQEKALLDASGLSLRVRETPAGPAPLHWYANPDGIYLCCSDASWLSALASKQQRRGVEAVASALANLEAAAPSETSAEDEGAGEAVVSGPEAAPVPPPPPPGPASRGGESVRGTMMLDQFVSAQGAPPSAAAAPMPGAAAGGAVPGGGGGSSRGTMLLQGPISAALAAPAPAAASPAARRPVPELRPAVVPPQDSAEQLQRLEHVCRLVRRARQPLCPINGTLVLLPFDLIQAGPREAEEVMQAARSDLATIQRTLQLRAPVTALVTGMEQESGFRELVRRVGRDRAAVQRFGRGNDLRSQPGVEELAALSVHVCGAFEDWVHTLFREKEALARPGNTRLYYLLCKVRSALKGRLTEILVGAFGHDAVLSPHDEPLLFSGCYFAATGPTEDRQAFVKGVFDKLIEEQDQVEWTERAWRSDRRLMRLALAGFALDALLVLGLGAVIVWRVFFK